MKIAKASVYTIDLPLVAEVSDLYHGGVSVGKNFLSIIVKLETDDGITGFGEASLWHQIQHQNLAGIKEILPKLIGKDPRETGRINDFMDMVCPHLTYAKSPIDIACWDIFAKSCNVPLYKLLGGKAQETFPTYFCIRYSTADERRRQIERAHKAGHKFLQVKIRNDPIKAAEVVADTVAQLNKDDTLLVDANCQLSLYDGLKFLELVDPTKKWLLEQPCTTMEACKKLQRKCGRVLLLDENANSIESLLKAHHLEVGDIFVLKIGRLGGITKTRQMRDLAVALDKNVRIEAFPGLEVINAATMHLSISTPSKNLFSNHDMHIDRPIHIVDEFPLVEDGRIRAPEKPGLGIKVKEELLGDPIFTC